MDRSEISIMRGEFTFKGKGSVCRAGCQAAWMWTFCAPNGPVLWSPDANATTGPYTGYGICNRMLRVFLCLQADRQHVLMKHGASPSRAGGQGRGDLPGRWL